ncbi:MAG: hypothetical protein J4F38_06260 [Pseudomonadales bacterium]|nr:hypothetical protein [Pseudomonadales bacterium]
MKATVIDTLRYANRLKEAGVEVGQAEAMSRALNDELTEGLVTKTDLDSAVLDIGGKIDTLDSKFEVRFAEVDARFAEMEGKFDARFAEMGGEFAKIDGKFEAVDSKFETLRSQNRYVFLVLALIAGLGLYNATAPHFLGKIGQMPVAESGRPAPAAEARDAGAEAAELPKAPSNG